MSIFTAKQQKADEALVGWLRNEARLNRLLADRVWAEALATGEPAVQERWQKRADDAYAAASRCAEAADRIHVLTLLCDELDLMRKDLVKSWQIAFGDPEGRVCICHLVKGSPRQEGEEHVGECLDVQRVLGDNAAIDAPEVDAPEGEEVQPIEEEKG